MRAFAYADLHCDYLSYLARLGKKTALNCITKDVKRWSKANCALQCFAAFTQGESGEDAAFLHRQLSLFAPLSRAFEGEGARAVLTVEGGGATGGNLEKAARLFSCGVRLYSPVWNVPNALGGSCVSGGGLTKKGKETVELALSQGVLPDISHASDKAAEEMLNVAKSYGSAVVASHTLMRSLCPSRRNVTDEQIKKIAASGGVVGICFVRAFSGNRPLVDHIRHLYQTGGEDVVSLGGDFYGTDDALVNGVGDMQRFLHDLSKYFTPRQIEKFAYSNVKSLL